MKVELAKGYFLKSDPQCYWIVREVSSKSGKNPGSTREERVSGYYRHLDDLMKSFIEHKFRSSHAEVLDELWDVIDELDVLTNEMIERIREI